MPSLLRRRPVFGLYRSASMGFHSADHERVQGQPTIHGPAFYPYFFSDFFACNRSSVVLKATAEVAALRYDEDWSLLSDRDCKKEALDEIKCVSLGRKDWYLSVGGEIRYRYENYEDPAFGVGPETSSGYILQRYLVHTDWHLGRHFRVFSQFQSGLEEGRNGGPRPTDRDIADLHQGFIDVTDSSQNLRLRIGRQEIEFGTGHLIGESEGLNIRRAFDGFRFTFKHGRWTWNSTLTHPVLVRPQAFDIPDHRQTEWGAGFTRARELGGWSGYYIGLNRKQAVFNGMAGQEVRETFGSRIWNQGGLFDYNADFILQRANLGRCSLHERRDHVAQAKIRAALRDTPRLRKRRLGPNRQRSSHLQSTLSQSHVFESVCASRPFKSYRCRPDVRG